MTPAGAFLAAGLGEGPPLVDEDGDPVGDVDGQPATPDAVFVVFLYDRGEHWCTDIACATDEDGDALRDITVGAAQALYREAVPSHTMPVPGDNREG